MRHKETVGLVPGGGLELGGSLDDSPNRMTRRATAATCLLLGLAVVIGLAIRIRADAPHQNSIARIGRVLPSLPVVDGSGRVVDLSKVASGRKTIIVFYSPDCQVCEGELPELRPFPPGLGLFIVNEEDRSSSEKFNSLGLKYNAMFYDRDRVLNRSFPLAGLPTILFVDERGVLRNGLVGAHEKDLVQQKLKEFAQLSP